MKDKGYRIRVLRDSIRSKVDESRKSHPQLTG